MKRFGVTIFVVVMLLFSFPQTSFGASNPEADCIARFGTDNTWKQVTVPSTDPGLAAEQAACTSAGGTVWICVPIAAQYCIPAAGSVGHWTCSGSCEVHVANCAAVGKVNGTGTCPSGICCGAASAIGTISFSNPLSFSTVQDATTVFLNALQGIIVTLAIIFIVIGGVLYIISGGDEGKIKTAKAAITAAMIGLAIAIAAPSFLKEIYIMVTGAAPAGVGGSTIAEIAGRVLNFLLSIVGVLALIMLVIGGAMYIIAAGDESKIETAKKIVKWAIIGIVVALGALVLVTQVANFF